MKLLLSTSHQNVEVDFISEVAVQTTNLYLVIYDYDASHFVTKDPNEQDLLIGNYSKFQLVKLQHIIYGHFYYDDKKIGCQVGSFVNLVGEPKMDTIMLSHDEILGYTFATPDSLGVDDLRFVIIDLDDFNRIRWMTGQKEFTLMEYIEHKISGCPFDEHGLSLGDHISLFSPGKGLDTSNIMTTKGMALFVEDQIKNNKQL